MSAYVPYIPEAVVVHLGAPDSDAADVTVSFTDYIKNVASSEIYPTWPEASLDANITAEVTFTLNRIYTEYYRSRGYNFDITNSTSVDQSYVYGRYVFENISQRVDEIFQQYIHRAGNIEPLFAVYCDGIETVCAGLNQWGTVTLANESLSSFQILQRYYGTDIVLEKDTPVLPRGGSFKGEILGFGSVGNEVLFMQTRLNRIGRSYPAISKINADGIYGSDTEKAVTEYQSVFSLPTTGKIDRATWYSIVRTYSAVKSLADLNSEGIKITDVDGNFPDTLKIGYSGRGVKELQYLLNFISFFNPKVSAPEIDGDFGEETRESVISFQREYSLEQTGEVNGGVWNKIYETYITMLKSLPEGYLDGITAPYPGSPLRVGSTGEAVLNIQKYINYIAETYTDLPTVTEDGIYGTETRNAVNVYQRLFSLEETGIVGAETYNSIAETYRRLYKSR